MIIVYVKFLHNKSCSCLVLSLRLIFILIFYHLLYVIARKPAGSRRRRVIFPVYYYDENSIPPSAGILVGDSDKCVRVEPQFRRVSSLKSGDSANDFWRHGILLVCGDLLFDIFDSNNFLVLRPRTIYIVHIVIEIVTVSTVL